MKATNGRSPPTDQTHSRAHSAPRLYTDAPVGEIIQFIFKNHLPPPKGGSLSTIKNKLLTRKNKKVMKTTVIGSGKNTAVTAKANSNNGASAKTGSNNPNPQTANGGIAPNKTFDTNGKADSEPKKAESPAPVTEQPKPQAEQPKAEPTKAELKEVLATQKPALNLEGTLKLVEELHRRKIQRDKLLDTIDTLETFEVAQKDDAEETDSNHYQGCELTIEDDKRRQFSTKNPFIIKKVAEYINALCLDRLAEIEGEIFLPA